MDKFTHIDPSGNARMVNVGDKTVTRRRARACARVWLPPKVWSLAQGDDILLPKGALIHTAVLAGIMGAKKTPELIPLCHAIALSGCDVEVQLHPDLKEIHLYCTAQTEGQTGVEMEALTGASVAALTVYDMCKAISHHIRIAEVRLLEKTGGKSDFAAELTDIPAPVMGLVLTGGKSQRMGTDKAWINYHGMPQWEWAASLLRNENIQVAVSCRTDQVDLFPAGTELVTDTFLNMGPIGGLLSAFRQYPDRAFLVLACDLPLLTPASVRQLLEQRKNTGVATAFASSDGLPEPLIALWEPTAYPLLLQAVGEGVKCPRKVLIRHQAHLITPDDPEVLSNFNTPEERASFGQE